MNATARLHRIERTISGIPPINEALERLSTDERMDDFVDYCREQVAELDARERAGALLSFREQDRRDSFRRVVEARESREREASAHCKAIAGTPEKQWPAGGEALGGG